MMNTVARTLSTWWFNRIASVDVLFDRRPQAITALRRIVAIDPGNEVARGAIGTLCAEGGDKAAAEREFEALVKLNPRNAEAWFNLGYIHDERDEQAAADNCFRTAVELDPKLDRAWYGLGLVLIRAGRLEEAIVAFRRNIKLQPMSPYGYYQLGMTYHHLGRADEAWKVHAELKGFEPRYAATLKRDIEITASLAVSAQQKTSENREETAALQHRQAEQQD